ncbi:MAG: sensor histidine kinase [Flavobacteriales bacterium]|nr:sensor histidine kinase [Flavobacteriales bacterium]
MAKRLFALCLLFNTVLCFGQQERIDSLKTEYKKSTADTTKLKILLELTKTYSSIDKELAFKYVDSMIRHAKTKNLTRYELTGYASKGVTKFRHGDFEEGIKIWKKAIHHTNIENHIKQKGNLLHNLAVGYRITQQPDSALIYLYESIEINESLKNYEALVANYGVISEEFLKENNKDSSYKYLDKMLHSANKSNDSKSLAEAYIKLANLNRKNYDYKGSLSLYDKAIKIYVEEFPLNLIMIRGLEFEKARTKLLDSNYHSALEDLLCIQNDYKQKVWDENFEFSFNNILLKTYLKLNEFEQAGRIYQNISYSNSENTFSKIDSLYYYLNTSSYEISSNNYNSGTRKKLLYALKIAEDIGENYDLLTVHESYADFLYRNEEYKRSYMHLQKSLAYKDSMHKAESKSLDFAQKRKFNEDLKEKENLALKAEKAEQEKLLAQQNKRNWQLGGGLATAVIGMGVFFIAFRRNQKQKLEIEQQKNKIENLQKELHHRLKNNLAFIDVFISLAKIKFTDRAYQEKLNELQNRINSMFEVHEQLFKKDNITTVNASSYISKLATNVMNAYANPNISVKQDVDPENELDSRTSFPLGIIINEFITNSYKYAFSPGESGCIHITLDETEHHYKLNLSDNGKGLPKDFDVENINTFGLDSIKLLTQEYNGSFSIEGDNGVTLLVTLPKQAA